MDISLMLNLLGKLSNLKIGINLCKEFDNEEAFKYYSKDFLTITEIDINETFDDFIQPIRNVIWNLILKEQKRLKKSTPKEYCAFGVNSELNDFVAMLYKLIVGTR